MDMESSRSPAISTRSIHYRVDQGAFSSVKREFLSCQTLSTANGARTVTASVSYVTKLVTVKQNNNLAPNADAVCVPERGAKRWNNDNGPTTRINGVDHFAMSKLEENLPQKSNESPTKTPKRMNGLENGKTDAEPQMLVFKDGHLVSGSLEALIHHLVPTADYYPDKKYAFAFLLSSRLFCKPHELLHRFHHTWVLQPNLSQEIIHKDRLHKSCANLVRLLSDWTEMFPYDFREDKMMRHVRKITHRCLQIDHRLKRVISRMMQNLLDKLGKLEKYEEFLKSVNVAAANQSINNVKNDVTEICPSPETLAQQLTRIESEKLSQIGPEEFVETFVKDHKDKEFKKVKNLESYVQFFNRMSNLVATEVCSHLRKRHRVRVIEYFIEVASDCFNRGNFNSSMAIISGLTLNSVIRLKKTWAKVDSAKLDILEHQMDPSSNFANYRSTLKAAVWRSQGAHDLKEKMVIPFFSLVMKDLHFINEGYADKLSNGHINFEKMWQFSKHVTQIINWARVVCTFEEDVKVMDHLLTTTVYSEMELALASFDCEPPENNMEREILKTLKWK